MSTPNSSLIDTAAILACSPELVRQLVADGELKGFSVGRGSKRKKITVIGESIDDYINRNMVNRDEKPDQKTTPPRRKQYRFVD